MHSQEGLLRAVLRCSRFSQAIPLRAWVATFGLAAMLTLCGTPVALATSPTAPSVAVWASAPSSPGGSSGSGQPTLPVFIVSVAAALGIGAIIAALIAASAAKRRYAEQRENDVRDQRRASREEATKSAKAAGAELRSALTDLAAARAATTYDDAKTLPGPIAAVMRTHSDFRVAVQDADTILGTRVTLAAPMDGASKAIGAFLLSVGNRDTQEDELNKAFTSARGAVTRIETQLTTLLEAKGGNP